MRSFFIPFAIFSLFLFSCNQEEIADQIVAPTDGTILPLPTTGPMSIDFPEDVTSFPESWKAEPITAEVEALDESLRPIAKTIIETALEKYPLELRTKYLSGVSLVGSLKFYGVAYGGTYMSNSQRIVLVYRKGFNAVGFEQRLHHEFSSILVKKNMEIFDEDRWKKGNEETFSYRAEGVIEEKVGERSEATKVLEAEQKKSGGGGSGLLKVKPELMERGFLTAYNQVSIEQDVNELAAHLFTNPRIWEYSRDYRGIDHKVDVLIDFYRALNPALDRIHFRNITEPREPAEIPASEPSSEEVTANPSDNKA